MRRSDWGKNDIDEIRFERQRKKDKEDWKGDTHLQVSVVTDRLGVSSSVSASGVRHRLAVWLLQQLWN